MVAACGKLFGHTVPCARRAQNSLGRVLAFLYTTDIRPRLFCLARCQGTRIGCRLRQAIRARSALRPQGAKLLRARARLYLPVPFLLCAHGSSNWLPRRGKLFGHAVPCARRAQNSLGRAKFTKILCSKQLLRSIQDFSARRAIITGLPKIAAKRDFWEEEEPPCKSCILPFGKMLTA